MKYPDYDAILASLPLPTVPQIADGWMEGYLNKISSTLLRAHLPGVALGELCRLQDGGLAEVVTVQGKDALLAPFNEPVGLRSDMRVRPLHQLAQVGVGPALLGRTLNALGHPIDGASAPEVVGYHPLEASPPDPLHRQPITRALTTGIRAIDGLLTIGQGQRLGIFAPAGAGKSTLLGMVSDGCDAEVIVLALIGERGREVREFLDHVLTPATRARSVVIVATSDRPALERIKAANTATTIAEYFRDQGARVLLLVDSLTRYARAVREIALAAGEPMVSGGYPPSLYARLPRLLERAGSGTQGSITALYTVLMEDKTDTLAEEVRSILDGHIVLSRQLAESHHYPAIDILASLSRCMPQLAQASELAAAARFRHLLSVWQEIELLVRVGEYRAGHDSDADKAVQCRSAMMAFLRQSADQRVPVEDTARALHHSLDEAS